MHNVRIERLWRDLTLGFGSKWKLFFQGLEVNDRLNPDSPAHIWLLHYLFLPAINNDAMDWAQAWNKHTLTQQDRRQSSPEDMFFFGMMQNGVRGLAPNDEDIGDPVEYGIDWDDFNDPQLLAHHDQENHVNTGDSNPFSTHHPNHLSHVELEEPASPLDPHQLQYLHDQLTQLPFFQSRSMDNHCLLWISALEICDGLFSSVRCFLFSTPILLTTTTGFQE